MAGQPRPENLISWIAYLVLAPRSSSSCRSSLPVLRNAVVVAIHGVRGRVVSDGRGRHLHRGRHDSYFQASIVPTIYVRPVQLLNQAVCPENRRLRKRGCSQKEPAELAALRIEAVSVGIV